MARWRRRRLLPRSGPSCPPLFPLTPDGGLERLSPLRRWLLAAGTSLRPAGRGPRRPPVLAGVWPSRPIAPAAGGLSLIHI
eukprot:5366068-Pleurochrysis_carterae.AAC.1